MKLQVLPVLPCKRELYLIPLDKCGHISILADVERVCRLVKSETIQKSWSTFWVQYIILRSGKQHDGQYWNMHITYTRGTHSSSFRKEEGGEVPALHHWEAGQLNPEEPVGFLMMSQAGASKKSCVYKVFLLLFPYSRVSQVNCGSL